MKTRHGKSVLTSMVIIATFLVLWLPFLVQNILAIIRNVIPNYNNTFTFAAVFIAMLNGIADPIILIVFNKDVKELIRKRTSIRRRDKYVKDFKSNVKKTKNLSTSTIASTTSN